jgi:hypothetical protein
MRRRTLIGSNSDGRHIDPSGGGAWPLRATNLGRGTRGGFHSFDYAPLPPKGAHRRWVVGGRTVACGVRSSPLVYKDAVSTCHFDRSVWPCGTRNSSTQGTRRAATRHRAMGLGSWGVCLCSTLSDQKYMSMI